MKTRTFKSVALKSIAIGIALLAASQSIHSETRADRHKLVGMRYLAARSAILNYGWRPSPSQCMGIAVNCRLFPEIDTCSGVELGLCGMMFVRRNRCLILETVGGPPSMERNTDTWVQDVTILRRRCLSKAELRRRNS